MNFTEFPRVHAIINTQVADAGPTSFICGLTTAGKIDCFENCGGARVALTLPGTFSAFDAGDGFGVSLCGIDSAGAVTCDNGTPPPGETFEEVSVGAGFACGIRPRDSGVSCWGELLDSCNGALPDVGQLSPPPGQYTHISSFFDHTCGILASGEVRCWGAGKSGDDPSTLYCNGLDPVNLGQSEVPAGTFAQVSAGTFNTCVVHTDGTLSCWGWNDNAQSSPPPGTFAQVAAGYTNSCAMKSDRTVVCWGSNTGGRSTPPADFPQAY